MLKFLFFVVISFALMAVPVMADVKTPNGKIIECFCTDTQGKRHELGDIICLTVDNRSFLAKCAMAQNNPIWREQQQGCNNSNLFLPKSTIHHFALMAR